MPNKKGKKSKAPYNRLTSKTDTGLIAKDSDQIDIEALMHTLSYVFIRNHNPVSHYEEDNEASQLDDLGNSQKMSQH